MVKVGIICEGDCEKMVVESDAFQELLARHDLKMVQAINVKGCGNLLPKHIDKYQKILEDAGANRIIILADLEYDPCIAKAKERIGARPQDIVIIARRQLEAWQLADTVMMRKLLNDTGFYFEMPENESVPYETIRKTMMEKLGRGIDKIRLSKRALNLGFSIENAAKHPNCASAQYFLDKLTTIS